MPFVELKTLPQAPKTPFVTIQVSSGRVGLSALAYEAMGRPEAVKLLYDADEQLIGIRTCGKHDNNAVAVTKHPSGKMYRFSIGIFRRAFNLTFDASRRYPLETRDGLFVIDLNRGEIVSPGQEVAQ